MIHGEFWSNLRHYNQHIFQLMYLANTKADILVSATWVSVFDIVYLQNIG